MDVKWSYRGLEGERISWSMQSQDELHTWEDKKHTDQNNVGLLIQREDQKQNIRSEERRLRDLDGEINGRTVMVNKALNHLRSFFESMTSDIEKMSRCLIVGKQQVLYPRQRRYHGTYVSVYIFSCFVYGFFHLLCSELRALVGCYHYPCRCPV